MSWIHEPGEQQPTDETRALYARDEADLGYVANFTKVFATRPPVYEAWRQLNGSIKAGMDLRTYELATLAAALRLRSSYCSLAHGKVLAETYVGADVVRAVAHGSESAELSPVDRAVMRLADTVASGAAGMDEHDLDELRALGVPDDQIFDVILAAAARCFFSTVLDASGARPDRAYAALGDDLVAALSVGRPVEGPSA